MKKGKLIQLSVLLFILLALQTTSFAQEQVTLVVEFNSDNLSDEDIALFEELNPDIDIVRGDGVIGRSVQDFELAAAGNIAPDVFFVTGTVLAGLQNRGFLLDITEYIEASELIQTDDFVDVVDYYIFDDRYYGLPKDWSQEFTLFINTRMFEEAGIAIPDPSVPLSYTELAELGELLTITDESGEVIQTGLDLRNTLHVIEGIVALQDEIIFTDDSYSELNLVDNPIVFEAIRYLYNLIAAGVNYGPINPTPGGGNPFLNGHVAITRVGYWFGARINNDPVLRDEVMMLPAPVWDVDLPRLNPGLGPSGAAIYSGTEHQEEAFRFLEFFAAGQPAINRASNGWGLPITNELEIYLPTETPFQAQMLEVVQAEQAYAGLLPRIPYLSTQTAWNEAWGRNIGSALNGDISFDEFVMNLETEVNLAILNDILSG